MCGVQYSTERLVIRIDSSGASAVSVAYGPFSSSFPICCYMLNKINIRTMLILGLFFVVHIYYLDFRVHYTSELLREVFSMLYVNFVTTIK